MLTKPDLPRPPESEWHQKACELIVRESVSLAEAATRLKVTIGAIESANLFRTKSFQRLLRAERLCYYQELGRDPDWGKKTAVGMLLHCAAELRDAGDYDKAAEVILKCAKIEGWLSNEVAQISVFGNLSQKDLDDARARLQGKPKELAPDTTGPN